MLIYSRVLFLLLLIFYPIAVYPCEKSFDVDSYDVNKELSTAEISKAQSRRKQIRKIFASRSSIDDFKIDRLVGLKEHSLKILDADTYRDLDPGEERLWIGSGHHYYSSSYESFRTYDQYLKIPERGRVVDLGAGPFKAAAYFGVVRKNVEVIGYEYLKTRVDAGRQVVRRLDIGDRARIIQSDLSKPNLRLEPANGYILMNPFGEATTHNLLVEIKQSVKKADFDVRILIFNHAYESVDVADKTNWLIPEVLVESGEVAARYGFATYLIDREKI